MVQIALDNEIFLRIRAVDGSIDATYAIIRIETNRDVIEADNVTTVDRIGTEYYGNGLNDNITIKQVCQGSDKPKELLALRV